jgi:hypothetical protein
MTTKKGLLFSETRIENEALGREFFASPENFAKKRGVNVEDLACPEATHAAMQRGYAFASDLEGRAIAPNSESMKELEKLATKHFGENFKIAMIPYGLQFCEKASTSAFDGITGSGTVTFLDGDGDVDESLE